MRGAPTLRTRRYAYARPYEDTGGGRRCFRPPDAGGVRGHSDVAAGWGRQVAASVPDPRALTEDILGPLLSAETRQAVARADSKPQALALMLLSPEFQRR